MVPIHVHMIFLEVMMIQIVVLGQIVYIVTCVKEVDQLKINFAMIILLEYYLCVIIAVMRLVMLLVLRVLERRIQRFHLHLHRLQLRMIKHQVIKKLYLNFILQMYAHKYL